MALQHDDLRSMGIASVGHRLTILKSVYDVKRAQDVPVESDHFMPLCTFLDPVEPPVPPALLIMISCAHSQLPRPRLNRQMLPSKISSTWWSSCVCGTNA